MPNICENWIFQVTMAWKGLESEELVQNLRQLLISFEPQLREAGSAEQAEDCLLHLEENDENFHR